MTIVRVLEIYHFHRYLYRQGSFHCIFLAVVLVDVEGYLLLLVGVDEELAYAAQLSVVELSGPLAVKAGVHPLQAGVGESLAHAMQLCGWAAVLAGGTGGRSLAAG